jgi:hypothetical protein
LYFAVAFVGVKAEVSNVKGKRWGVLYLLSEVAGGNWRKSGIFSQVGLTVASFIRAKASLTPVRADRVFAGAVR